MSAQLPRCRHAVNPAHVCTEACSAAIAEQEALYGPPHRDAAYGRWTAQCAVKLPSTALAVARVTQELATFTGGEGCLPVVLTDAQTSWRARDLWSCDYFASSFGGEHVLCSDKVPYRSSDEPAAQTLRVTLGDAAAYCQGLEAGKLLADRERGAGTPFAVVGWSPLVAHRALEEQVQPLLAPHIQDGTPPALRLHMCTIILAPPGATHRLAVAPRDTHAMIAQARWHAPSHAPVPHLTDLPWPGNQMEGALQVVCYPPNDTKAVYGNERRPGQSSFDPFAADFNAFPLARGATPHACVLHPGDTLLVPRGWWVTTRQLTPGVLLRREWVSAGAHAAQFQAASAASAQAPAQPGRVAGVEVQPPASDEDSTAEDTGQDIFVRAAAHRSRGNDFFTAGRIREATEAYSNAIDLLTLHSQDEAQRIVLETLDVNDACGSDEEAARQLCACLANRAACWLRRKQWAKAMRDCNAVLRAGRPHDEVTIKALFRRAKAHEGLGDADSAQADFRRVLELQPHNSDAAEQLEMYKSVLHRIVVMSYGDEDMRRRQKGGI